MPTLIPPVSIDMIEPYSEQQVIAALVEQLPKECKLYHNFEYISSSENSGKSAGKKLREGEIDAVILWPEKGLLVLEIKGGEIGYCSDTARWTTRNRNGCFIIKDPMSQARHNMHELISAMELELNTKLKGSLTHGYAVVFPTTRGNGSLPHSADTAIVCDQRVLALLVDLSMVRSRAGVEIVNPVHTTSCRSRSYIAPCCRCLTWCHP